MTHPLSDLARAVAPLLGSGWTAAPDDVWPSFWQLRHSDGRRFTLDLDAGRVHASGQLPSEPDDVKPSTDGINSGSIRMTATKTPERIAADITRRLLPDLAAAHAEWHRRVSVLREQEEQRTAAAEQLARVPGLSAPKRAKWRNRTETAYALSWDGPARANRYTAKPSARVSVDADAGGAHVRMELSGLTADQAERVLAALTDPAPEPLDVRGIAQMAVELYDNYGYDDGHEILSTSQVENLERARSWVCDDDEEGDGM